MEKLKLGFSPALQAEIITLCINDPSFFLKIQDVIEPKHFMDDTAAKCYAVLQQHYEDHKTVPDKEVIKYHFSKFGWDIDDDYFVKETRNKEWLLEETLRLVRHQEMKSFILQAAESVDKENPNLDALEDDIRRIINIRADSNPGLVYFNLDERFSKLITLNTVKIATGITSVDDALGGGVAKKELVCFAAPPGAGKSYLLAIAGANMLLAGHNVVHYTLEMSEELTSLRYDSVILNKTRNEILNDISASKESLGVKKRVLGSNLIIKEYPTKGASVATIRGHLKSLREEQRFVPDVVIVDYGDILKSTRAFSSRYDEQGNIFQDLRGLGQELDIPILSATQTNRGSMSKDIVTMEDLGDSFDKARIMDALFCIVQKPEEKEDGFFRLYDAKVRNGRAGRMHKYEIDYARAQLTQFGEVDQDDE